MELKVIDLNIDKTKSEFSSDECKQLISIYESYYPKYGFELPWVAYFIYNNNEIVGSCGFTKKPQGGKVEIAYWTFKKFEGQGIASFACKELVKIAQKADHSLLITAKTEPCENSSTKILKNCGFVYSEVVQDPEIGDAWLWVYRKN